MRSRGRAEEHQGSPAPAVGVEAQPRTPSAAPESGQEARARSLAQPQTIGKKGENTFCSPSGRRDRFHPGCELGSRSPCRLFAGEMDQTTPKRLPWQFHPGLFRSRPHAAVRQRGPGPSLPRPPGPHKSPMPIFRERRSAGSRARPARISKPGAAVRVGCAP